MPKGLTSEQIVARLLENDVLSGNIREIPREGTLLPETYNFTRGMTREQMIQRMQQAQARMVKEVWDRAHARSADQVARTARDARLHRREGNRPSRKSARASPPCS